MDNQPYVIERIFMAPIEKVWEAISNKVEMKKWYFDLAEFNPVVGFEFRFTGGPTADRQYLHICEITEVIPYSKLTHSWRYDGYEGNSFVSWELLVENNATKVRLTHAGLETFPQSNADLAKENFAIGWTSILDSSLNNYLGK